MSAAHGGQVVLSPSTVSLLESGSFELTDLGEHRFKDLRATERVFQLGEGSFPPLKSLHRSNLPVPATPFLGREEELAAVVGMLDEPDVRLVSLVGPGGTGKTRLALQAAAEASDAYPDGVFWAPLAPLRDPALVLPAIAAALSVMEGKDSSPVDDLARALAGRRLLVLIDNVEHLMPDAADLVGAFVEACPTVTTVVTTRERLQLPGEHVYAVPPMSETDGEALFRSRAATVGVELEASEELRNAVRAIGQPPPGARAGGGAHGRLQPGAAPRPALPAPRPAQGRTWGGRAAGDAALDDRLEPRPARRRRAGAVSAAERVRRRSRRLQLRVRGAGRRCGPRPAAVAARQEPAAPT